MSPLHYRHGSIIVRGGKIIGQGFNTYRPGFDGGALKTGVLPSSALDGHALTQLKQRLKYKSRSKGKPNYQDHQQDAGVFIPLEILGTGHNANKPLSMHSEVMAIRSALSLSSGTMSSQTSARAAAYHQKPCFRLPSDSKTRELRARTLYAYAEAVCMSSETETSGGTGSIQTPSFEPPACRPGQLQHSQSQQSRRVSTRGGPLEGDEREETLLSLGKKKS